VRLFGSFIQAENYTVLTYAVSHCCKAQNASAKWLFADTRKPEFNHKNARLMELQIGVPGKGRRKTIHAGVAFD